jgi:Bacterial inner membrane protein
MFSELLWIHATGVCALALNVIALVRTCEKALRIQSGLAGAIWALNNLLLGAHTAAALSLLSAGRTATSAVTLSAPEGTRRLVFAGFLLLTLAIGALTWHGWASVLMVVASVLSTVAVFYLRGRSMRLAMLLVSALWMYNAWLFDSWEQMAANLLTAAAALYGARRVEGPALPATGGCRPSPAAASS